MDRSKVTKQLEERLARTPMDSLVEVVLEIQASDAVPERAGASRREVIATRRKQFLDVVAPVEKRIQSLGSKVLDHAWINQTLRVRVLAGQIDQLTEPDCVALVDTPSPISRE